MVTYLKPSQYNVRETFSGLSDANNEIYLEHKRKCREVHANIKKIKDPNFKFVFDGGKLAAETHAEIMLGLTELNEIEAALKENKKKYGRR